MGGASRSGGAVASCATGRAGFAPKVSAVIHENIVVPAALIAYAFLGGDHVAALKKKSPEIGA
jgi:hypothetical protein